MAETQQTSEEPAEIAPPSVRVISALHVLYLLALPTLANFTVVPAFESTLEKVAWFVFGVLCIPLVLAAMKIFNRISLNPWVALFQVLFVPVAAGVWWWMQEGTVMGYFLVALAFESMAVFLSMFFMSFIPLRYYDPDNPQAHKKGIYLQVLLVHGILLAGCSMALLSAALWSTWTLDPFWTHPVTIILFLTAAGEYLYRNYQYQLHKEEAQALSIEPLVLLAPVPWFISWVMLV